MPEQSPAPYRPPAALRRLGFSLYLLVGVAAVAFAVVDALAGRWDDAWPLGLLGLAVLVTPLVTRRTR